MIQLAWLTHLLVLRSLYIPANDLTQLNLTVTSITSGTATTLTVSAGVTIALGGMIQAVNGASPALGKPFYDPALGMAGFVAFVDCSAGPGELSTWLWRKATWKREREREDQLEST